MLACMDPAAETTEDEAPNTTAARLQARVERIAAMSRAKRERHAGPYRFPDPPPRHPKPKPAKEPEPPKLPEIDPDRAWWNK